MSDLTFIITRWTGKTYNFSISSRVFVWSSLFFVFYLIASLIIIYECFDLWRTNIERSTQIAGLEHEIVSMKKELQGATQQFSLFKNAVHSLQATSENQTEAGKDESIDSKPAQIDGESTPVEKESDEPKETLVDIDGFTVHKNGSEMDVLFKVINLRQDEAAISGYVHVIAIDPKSDPPKFWPYPKTTLQNGIPVNYNQGESFTINRFRTIKGRYVFKSKAEAPSLIKVLVYDEDGNLFLQKEFEVKDIS
jgi:hypothetical protein